MVEATIRPEQGIWESDRGIAVEYSLGVLEEARRLAVDGFNAFSHGGRETGGILYGTREDTGVRVHSFAELACEHALGPRFLLSDNDRETLAGLLQPRSGLEAVGWFRAHTRGGLDLDAADREMFERYFAKPLSLALILKPTHWGPASAAFFVRGASGEALPSSVREFPVEPLKPPAPAPEPEPEAEPEAATAGSAPVAEAPRNAVPRREVFAAPEAIKLPPQPRSGGAWVFWTIVFLAAVALFIYAFRPVREVGLRVYAIAPGQVRIEWNHELQAAPDGASGELEIRDGHSTTKIPLTAEQIRWGNVTYVQRTGHITVRLRLDRLRPGAPLAEDSVQFVGAQAPQSATSEVLGDPHPPAVPVEVADAHRAPLQPVPETRKQFEAPAAPQSIHKAAQIPAMPSKVDGATPLPPNPPAVEPGTVRPTGLPDFLSSPPLHAASPPPAPSVKAPVYSGARAGRLIWTGNLGRRGVIEVDGAHVSIGSLSGALPGVPVSLNVLPAEFTRDGLIAFTADPLKSERREAPAKSNGWNAMHFKFDDGRARQLVVLEAPNASNDFKRLALRNDSRDCSVVVVDWSVK
jgi:hypothetical protein